MPSDATLCPADGAADPLASQATPAPPSAAPSRPSSVQTPSRAEKREGERAEVKNFLRDVVSQPLSAPTSPVLARRPLRPFAPAHGEDVGDPALGRPADISTAAAASPHAADYPSTPTSPVTLSAASKDLKAIGLDFARLLPFFPPGHPIRVASKRIFAPPFRALITVMARAFSRWGVMPGDLIYSLLVLLFKWIINLFFREIRPRGAHNIPRQGACIFVAAPHHNQFLDPLNLMAEARLNAGRQISFIAAEKSVKRPFVGLMIRLMQSIPVTRAADSAKKGTGVIYLEPGSDGLTIRGHKTRFKTELEPRRSIALSKYFDSATVTVTEVIDDTTVKVAKAYSGKPKEALLAAGGRLADGKSDEGSANSKRGITPEGLTFTHMPYVDQTKMYTSVYTKLKEGGCIGIFPEGGSHDQTDLLPLKAGVAIMALGAMSAVPGLKIRIVPVGLSYFHAHRFRSRAVVEFGAPIEIPAELVKSFEQGGEQKRKAVAQVLDLTFDGLKSVTVRAPDYETLMVIQAARRMYKPPGQTLSLGQVVELNRRFIAGYIRYKDEPQVVALKNEVARYNHDLRQLGIKDHQVDRANRPMWKSLILLLYRTGLVSAWTLLALPGVILNAPMFITASIISRKKAKEALAASTVKLKGNDVLATWKVLVSLGMAPILYSFYIAGTTYLAYRYRMPRKYIVWVPLWTAFAIGSAGYSSLRFGENGMDIYKSLRPLFLSLTGNHDALERLRAKRADLSTQIATVIDEFGPQLYEDFPNQRVIPSSKPAPSSDRKAAPASYGDNGTVMDWLDEHVFGWSRYAPLPSSRNGLSGASTPGSPLTSSVASLDHGQQAGRGDDDAGDEADYEAVVSMISRHHGPTGETEPTARATGRAPSTPGAVRERRRRESED